MASNETSQLTNTCKQSEQISPSNKIQSEVTLLPNESTDTFGIFYETKSTLSPSECSNYRDKSETRCNTLLLNNKDIILSNEPKDHSIGQITTLIKENLRKNNSISDKLNEIVPSDQICNLKRPYQQALNVINCEPEDENIPFKKTKELNVKIKLLIKYRIYYFQIKHLNF